MNNKTKFLDGEIIVTEMSRIRSESGCGQRWRNQRKEHSRARIDQWCGAYVLEWQGY